MKVLFFGSYVKTSNDIPSGNGGTLLKKILESQDVKVLECHSTITNFSSFISSYVKLFFKHMKLDYDVMIIPWRGILTLPLAKLIHKKPIVFFPAFSIYDTLVNDRKKIKKNSIKAKFVHYIDKKGCNMADLVILESTEEIKYFVEEFDLPKQKFRQLPLSSDESIFFPQPSNQKQNEFQVFFFGSFIPLHGIDVIIRSAIILKKNSDISFIICGDGQTRPEIENLIKNNDLKNIKLLGMVTKEILIKHLHQSNICLGIFGDSIKSHKVVTNKVFQILASKKPLITMNSPAATEVHLKNGVNCILVNPKSPQELAEAILFLKNNPDENQRIAEAGYQTYMDYLSMDIVGKQLIGYLEQIKK